MKVCPTRSLLVVVAFWYHFSTQRYGSKLNVTDPRLYSYNGFNGRVSKSSKMAGPHLPVPPRGEHRCKFIAYSHIVQSLVFLFFWFLLMIGSIDNYFMDRKLLYIWSTSYLSFLIYLWTLSLDHSCMFLVKGVLSLIQVITTFFEHDFCTSSYYTAHVSTDYTTWTWLHPKLPP